ncbi:slit homolog 2 protein-like [Patella vulgata]|uniref:slit homolog 2 protein-like n=1 Tax=Patella vulgata TaxID=6465 RepID=UPI00217FC6BD|nr:slit homolog 2 protein-like [Patella vulgata]
MMNRYTVFVTRVLLVLLLCQDINVLFILVMGQSQEFVVCPQEKCPPKANSWQYCDDCCQYNYHILNQLYISESCEINSTSYFVSSLPSDANYLVSHLHGCLPSIPENICEFPRIQYLDLYNNSITELPKLSCLRQLVHLDLSSNQIRILKAGIFDGLNKLRYIDLSRNKIHTIEMGVFHPGLTKIKRVNLHHNNLIEADVVWVLGITHIFCYFDLSYNKITKLTNKSNFTMDPSKTYGPGYISLRNNKMRIFDTKMLTAIRPPFPSLVSTLFWWSFNMDNNIWHCDCHLYPLAALMSVIGKYKEGFVVNRWTDITCSTPPNLKGKLAFIHKNLSDFVCNVTDSCPSACLCQEQPDADRMVINCQNAGLSQIPIRLPFHENLFLNFQNNSIEVLPGRPYMARIIHLDMSNNKLTKIAPEVFANSRDQLKYLNLAYNRLKYLPETIQNLRSAEIDLSNNMFICSCDSLWLKGWFESKPDIKNRSNITCSTVNGDQRLTIDNLQPDEFNCRVVNSVTKPISIVLGIFCFLIIVLIVVVIYFRFEIMVILHTHLPTKRKRKLGDGNGRGLGVFVLLNEASDADRMWVIENLIPYFDRLGIKSYISFRDGIIGEVTADANITNIHNSRSVVAVMSKTLFKDPLKLFELNESYCHKVKQRNGQLVLIKLEDFCPSLINNGHIRAMFKLKQFIKADDVNLYEKISSQIYKVAALPRGYAI